MPPRRTRCVRFVSIARPPARPVRYTLALAPLPLDAAHSTSFLPPFPALLPRLPLELHLHILRLAFPPHPEDDYTQRNSDIVRCCLVSKAWYAYAEPLLWVSVTVCSRACIGRMENKQLHEKRLRTRNLAYRGWSAAGRRPPTGPQFRRLLRLFPNVEHVCLSGRLRYWGNDVISRVSGDDFTRLTNLQSLSAYCAHSFYMNYDMSLPKLRFLSVCGRKPLDHPPVRRYTPALRHLSMRQPPPWLTLPHMIDYCCTQSSGLFHILEVDTTFSAIADKVFHVPFPHLLLTCTEHDLANYTTCSAFSPSLPHPPRHLRLSGRFISWSILTTIFLLPHRPRSLFLPRLPPFPSRIPVADEAARAAFLERCEQEGVEVRFYRLPTEYWRERECVEFREYVEERETEERT